MPSRDRLSRGMEIEIRRAARDRASALILADLGWRTFDETFAPHTPRADMDRFLNETFTVDRMMRELADERNVVYLAFVDESPAAYLKASTQTEYLPECVAGPKPIEIARLYVDRRYQRMGLGTTLMNKAFEVAREKECETLWLSVWEHNEPAKAFYARFGFEIVGSHPYPVGNDPQIDLLMRRTI